MSRERWQQLVALVSGLLFGAGLLLSGMTRPVKVLGFLDVAGDWDPSLIFVIVSAIGVHMLAYRLIRGRASPLFAERFALPTRRDIDARLVIGAVLFGVGWGMAGYCPGPGLVSLASFGNGVLVFVVALAAGTFAASRLEAALARRA